MANLNKFEAEISIDEEELKLVVEEYVRKKYAMMLTFTFPSVISVRFDDCPSKLPRRITARGKHPVPKVAIVTINKDTTDE